MVFEDKNLKRSYQRPNGVKYTKTNLEGGDIYSRIASEEESLNAGQQILEKYGYSKANSPTQLAHKLSAIVMNAGEPALNEMAKIHPDRDLILKNCSVPQEPVTIIKEVIKEVPAPSKNLNDCGCGGNHSAEGYQHDCGCGGHHSAEGHAYSHGNYRFAEGASAGEAEKNKYLKPALLVSFTALAIAVIFKW